jgi:hypothetical protein
MVQRQHSASTQIPSVRPDNSRPFLTQKVVLNSLHAQQVFDRGYEMCANALFSLSVVLRFIGPEAQAQEVDALVDASIDQSLEDLRQESRRLREVAESNGIESAIGYTSARTVEVKITSPRAIRYLAIIREFDGMLAQMDALWLSSVITDRSIRARGVRVEAADSQTGGADPADRQPGGAGGAAEGGGGYGWCGRRVSAWGGC